MHEIKIGTLIGAGVADSIPEFIPHGFETFSIVFWGDVKKYDLEAMAAKTKEMFKGTDCKISCLSTYGNPLMDDEFGANSIESFKLLIDAAEMFGTDLVTGFAGRVNGKPVDESIPKFKEVFSPLADKAQKKNVRLAFEHCTWDGNWKTGEFNMAFTPQAWEMMFDAIPSENLGLQWEPCHLMIQLIDPIANLRKWVNKVFCLHGKDATVAWDVIKEEGIGGAKPFVWHRTPGFGDSNWKDIISILRMNGFKGSIDIEGYHDPVYRKELEMTGQVHALNYLKNCRGGEFIPNAPGI